MANEATTAQILGAYHRELRAEGIESETAQTLVIEAARQLLRDDLVSVRSLPESVTWLTVSIPIDAARIADKHDIELAATDAALGAVGEFLSK